MHDCTKGNVALYLDPEMEEFRLPTLLYSFPSIDQPSLQEQTKKPKVLISPTLYMYGSLLQLCCAGLDVFYGEVRHRLDELAHMT